MRVFGGDPENFGTHITPYNLPEVQAEQYRLLLRYEKTHSEDVQRVVNLYTTKIRQVCQVRAEFCRPNRPTMPGDNSAFSSLQQ